MVARLMPDELVPPVVAVVVAAEPGPWFEECLGGLAAQDYPNLDVLVVDVSADEEGSRDVAERVAAALPSAFLRRHRPGCGYAAGANVALEAVEGATHLLVCHDDVVLAPDVCRLLVEEAYRSNAGVVAPKVVAYEDPERLLHVGLGADRYGTPVPRVERGELDQGQHDEVREVFSAPGGCVLVREDLFRALGGFDEAMTLFGEDLDFGWRAQLAGARVVVAPAARVRHLEASARGLRGDGDPRGLQRRHELRAALKCHGRVRLLVVLPALLGLALAEAVVATLRGDREHARRVVAAWRWNLGELKSLVTARAALRHARRVRYRRVEARLAPHSVRLRRFLRVPLEGGLPAAESSAAAAAGGAEADGRAGAEALPAEPAQEPRRGGEWVREVEESLRGAGRRATHGLRPVARERVALFGAAAVVLAFGLRGLVGGHLPVLGGLGVAPPPLSLLGRFLGGWHDAGVQRSGAAPPALAVLGLGGLLLGGSTSQFVKLILLGSPVVAAVGCARLVAPLGSRRARDAAALAVLFAPLAWDDVARGDLQALVALAAAPFLLARLARAGGLLSPSGGRGWGRRGFATQGVVAARRGWRGAADLFVDEAVPLGLLLALATALAPVTVVVAGEIVVGVVLGSLLAGGLRPALRAAAVVVLGVAVAFVVLLPWSATLVGPGARAAVLTGLAPAGSPPSLAALLRLAPGPAGPSLLGFGLLGAASFALLVGRGERLAWATRAWALVLVSVGLAWAGAEGWLGGAMGATGALLAPAAVGIALAIGLGVAAFEVDLPASRFGWRQPAALVATGCFLVALFPVVALTPSGRFGLPSIGYGQVLGWIGSSRAPTAHGRPASSSPRGSLVLWAGAPGALPLGGWPAGGGLEVAVSRSGAPDLTRSYPSTDPARAAAMASALETALEGRTVELGALLAPLGVGYVVVPEATAPVLPGVQSARTIVPPANLLGALGAQTDLRQLPAEGGVAVFEDVAAAAPTPLARRGGEGVLRVLGLLAALAVLVGLLVWRRRRSRALLRALARSAAESMQTALPQGEARHGLRGTGPVAGWRGGPRHARQSAAGKRGGAVVPGGESAPVLRAQPAGRSARARRSDA